MKPTTKHPKPPRLRPKLGLGVPFAKKDAAAQKYVAGQAKADPQNKLLALATDVANARVSVLARLKSKADIKAAADDNQAHLVIELVQLDDSMVAYAEGAASFAGADPSVLASLGVDMAAKPVRGAHDLVATTSLFTVGPGAVLGEALLKCRAVPYAGAYQFEWKLEPSQPGDPYPAQNLITTKYASARVAGLPAEQLIRGRVRAVGGSPGPWSDEVLGRAK